MISVHIFLKCDDTSMAPNNQNYIRPSGLRTSFLLTYLLLYVMESKARLIVKFSVNLIML